MSQYDVFHMKTPYLTPCQTAFMTIKIVGLRLQARQASAIGLPRRHCVDVQDMLYEQSVGDKNPFPSSKKEFYV